MVAGSISVEIESPLEAKRFWNAMAKDGDNILLKQAPHKLSGITILQGDGGVGTIRQLDLTYGDKDVSYVKIRVDEIDEEKLVYVYSYVEGGPVGKRLASMKHEIKYIAKEGGGCLCTSTYHYDTLLGISPDVLKLEQLTEELSATFKNIEAYLVSNPTLYC